MDCLISLFEPHLNNPWAAVVHIGADLSLMEGRTQPVSSRHVLAQGDPETATQLAQSLSPPALVLSRPVTANGGPVRWHRYNLKSLNGPIDAANLVRFYPRLRQSDVLSLEAISFRELLESALADVDSGPQSLLIMDIPGQEAELLASVPATLLSRFGRIVVRGCADSPDLARPPLAKTLELLEEACFAVIGSPVDDPLWPAVALAFDTARWQQHELARHEREQMSRLDDLQRKVAALTHERDEWRGRFENALQAESICSTELKEVSSRATIAIARVKDLEAQLSQQTQYRNSAEEQVDLLRTHCNRLNEQVASQNANMQESALRVIELEQAMSSNQQRTAGIEQQLAAKVQRVGDLEQVSSAKSVQLDKYSSQIKSLQDQLDECRRQMKSEADRLCDELSHCQAELAQRSHLVGELETEMIRHAQDRLVAAQLLQERDALEQQTSDLRAGLQERVQRIAELEQIILSSEARTTELEQICATKVRRVGELEQASGAKSLRIEALGAQLAESEARITASSAREHDLFNELAQIQADFPSLQRTVATLQQELESAQQQASELRCGLHDRALRIAELERLVVTGEARSAELDELLATKVRRVGDLEQASASKSQQIDSLMAQLSERSMRESALAARETELTEQLVKVEAQLQPLLTDLQERHQRIGELESESANKSLSLEQLGVELSATSQERDEGILQLAERNQALAAKTARILEAEQAYSVQAQKLEQVRKHVEDLQRQLDASAKERMALLSARDEQTRAVQAAKQQTTAVEAELVELLARYGLLQEEMIKAEAQIELISDLLLRESRL